jgi:hypothetical protein
VILQGRDAAFPACRKLYAQLTNLDFNQVALSAFTLAADQTLSHLAKVVPGLAQTNVRAIAADQK